MPTYIPTVNELQEVFNLAKAQHLLDLPGKDLLDRFFGKNGNLPPELPLPPSPELRANPRSWLLAMILVMTRPRCAWDANEVQDHFKEITGELCAAWDAQAHSNQQKLRKTADHAVVFGVRNGWQSSLDILYWLIQEPVKASLRFVNIVIPGLTACWGYPIQDDAPLIATLIRNRMLKPFRAFRLDAGDALQFTSREEHLEISPHLETVLAGCRRNFRVQSGKAILSGPEEFNHVVLPSQRLMIRGLDEGQAEIQVAHFVPNPHGGAIGGRRCSLDIGQTALLTAVEPSEIEAWSCTCGTWRCDERHRLSAWNPAALPPNASLRTFLWTAVKGPGLGFRLEAFAANMIYPILCEGV